MGREKESLGDVIIPIVGLVIVGFAVAVRMRRRIAFRLPWWVWIIVGIATVLWGIIATVRRKRN
jgi:uncharacterized membrane protein YhaH (DUF805 family)